MEWTDRHMQAARARLLELAARLIRDGREHEPDPSCCVDPPLSIKTLLLDGGMGATEGHFRGAVKIAGFNPAEEVRLVHVRANGNWMLDDAAIDHYREGLGRIFIGEADPRSIAASYLGEDLDEKDRTFAIIKPDAVRARLVGAVIARAESEGFAIVRMKDAHPPLASWENFYGEHVGKPFFDELVGFMSSGPVVFLELRAPNAAVIWRHVIGATDPRRARPGTLRDLYGNKLGAMMRNVVHGSDSDAAATREIEFFFGGASAR